MTCLASDVGVILKLRQAHMAGAFRDFRLSAFKKLL